MDAQSTQVVIPDRFQSTYETVARQRATGAAQTFDQYLRRDKAFHCRVRQCQLVFLGERLKFLAEFGGQQVRRRDLRDDDAGGVLAQALDECSRWIVRQCHQLHLAAFVAQRIDDADDVMIAICGSTLVIASTVAAIIGMAITRITLTAVRLREYPALPCHAACQVNAFTIGTGRRNDATIDYGDIQE